MGGPQNLALPLAAGYHDLLVLLEARPMVFRLPELRPASACNMSVQWGLLPRKQVWVAAWVIQMPQSGLSAWSVPRALQSPIK